MKAHKTIMAGMATLALLLIVFAPKLGVGAGFGLLLLICPLMMFGMMYAMGKNNDHKH